MARESAEVHLVFFISCPSTLGSLRYELHELPARVTAKTVIVESCSATGWRSKFTRAECHFSAEAAMQAKRKEAAGLEARAAEIRAALADLEAQQ